MDGMKIVPVKPMAGIELSARDEKKPDAPTDAKAPLSLIPTTERDAVRNSILLNESTTLALTENKDFSYVGLQIPQGKDKPVLYQLPFRQNRLLLLPDREHLITWNHCDMYDRPQEKQNNKTIAIWDIEKKQLVSSFECDGYEKEIALLPNKTQIMIGCKEGSNSIFMIWDISDLKKPQKSKSKTILNSSYYSSFASDGDRIFLTHSTDDKMYVTAMDAKKEKALFVPSSRILDAIFVDNFLITRHEPRADESEFQIRQITITRGKTASNILETFSHKIDSTGSKTYRLCVMDKTIIGETGSRYSSHVLKQMSNSPNLPVKTSMADIATDDEVDAVCNLAKFANTKKSRWINFIACFHDPDNDKEYYFNKVQMDLRNTDNKMISRDKINRKELAEQVIGIIKKTMEPRGPRDVDQINPTDSGRAILKLLCTHSKGSGETISDREIELIRGLLAEFYPDITDPLAGNSYHKVKELLFKASNARNDPTPKAPFT